LALLATMILVVSLLQFVPAQYIDRLKTLLDILPGSEQPVAEVSFRGRLSENMSAWHMFEEHPFLGVGLNNYANNYQEYSRELGLDPRRESRSAHSMYLQIAAEQGLLGLAAFALLLWLMVGSLYRARIDFIRAGMPDYANMTAALSLGILGFLMAGTFLHLIYPRFWWLLVGIALAVPQVARYELNRRRGTP
jgi:O-antigen ligase